MSPKKRLAALVALVALLSLGFSAPGEAQGRARRGRSVVVGGGGFYPRYYPGYYFADPFWYGYPWFPYQYPIGPYPYPYYGYDREGSVRLDVSPQEAEVFVDGYYAGIVDDFDGVFQRLHLPRGEHEITLYQEGYRTFHQNVYLTPSSTFKVRHTMERLAPGDVAEPRPSPQAPPPGAQAEEPSEPPRGRRREPFERRLPPPRNQRAPRDAEASASGTLAIRVQPGNATVTIDGERWEGPQGQERLIVEVSEGPHRVQVERDGYESFSTEVVVRRGETTPLNVSLRTR